MPCPAAHPPTAHRLSTAVRPLEPRLPAFALWDSPTLIILAALLSGLVTVVLFAVWFFNHHIPGLRMWVLAFLSSSVFSASLLARDWGA